ncbi:MAG: type II toxin-antitoxin system RelE/ParE family toxin [Spirochaetota bacterium]
MKAIFWTTSANQDFVEIADYLSEESLGAAEALINRVDQELTHLAEFPQIGRVVPELERNNVTRFRELVLSPWRIVYREEKERIFIVTVFDARRNIEDILLRRVLRE